MFLDIHSHILPGVDDGAKSLDISLSMLKIMKNQGITDVIATPHFYADSDNFEDYTSKIKSAFIELKSAIKGKELPNIYLGSEVLYFRYIGNSQSMSELSLNNSNFFLLELADNCINSGLFEDIDNMINNLGLTPIIAHLERYYRAPNYKRLLQYINQNNILTQINACSFFEKPYKRIAEKLIKENLVNFIATDAHSDTYRAPALEDGLTYITKSFSENICNKFKNNSLELLNKIK